MAKKKKISPLAKALLETADDMRKAGLMDKATHEKITLRHLGATGVPKARSITGPQIRAMRERAKLSQAVFAQPHRCHRQLFAAAVRYRHVHDRSGTGDCEFAAEPADLHRRDERPWSNL